MHYKQENCSRVLTNIFSSANDYLFEEFSCCLTVWRRKFVCRRRMCSRIENGYIKGILSFQIITSGGVTYKNEPWHRDCFTCSNCNNSLAGQRFTSRDDKPYCADCFGELFAKRCTACSKPITGIYLCFFLPMR